MEFSTMTGLDVIVLASVAVAVIAIIAIILLLSTIGRKISEDTHSNKDASFRFTVSRTDSTLTLVPIKYNSGFGKVSFLEKATESTVKNSKADIVFNSIAGSPTYTNGIGGVMHMKIHNMSKHDMHITRVTCAPGYDGTALTGNAATASVFSPTEIKKGTTANFSFYCMMADNKAGNLSVDLEISNSAPTVDTS